MDEDFCIFCGRVNGRVMIKENGYKGKKCPKCGLIFISPHPSYNAVINLYNERPEEYLSFFKYNILKYLIAKHHLGIIKKFVKTGTLLEIGAGSGTFLALAEQQGFDAYGVEVNRFLAKYINEKLGIPCQDIPLNFSSFSDKKFDVVYFCDVLSHFYDPISELSKIVSKLKKNGIVIFETGNGGDIREKYLKVITSFQYPDHLFLFSELSVKILLRKIGLEPLEVFRFSILPELRTNNLVALLFTKNAGVTHTPFSNDTKTQNTLVRTTMNIFLIFEFMLRYKLGSLLPKTGQPQTVIYIARKI